MFLSLFIALAGCGSDSQGSLPPEQNPPVSDAVVPPADGAAPFSVQNQLYTLEEDSSLRVRLTTEPAVDANFVLLDESLDHQLVLSDDGHLQVVPASDFHGEISVEYYAWNETGGTRKAELEFVVSPVEDPPVVTFVPELFVEQGRRYLARLYASDADGDDLFFEAENVPAWLEFDPDTGILRGYPAQSDVGSHTDINLSVRDATGIRTSVPPFTIVVLDINERPTLNPSGLPENMRARDQLTINLNPDDPDGDAVSFVAEPNAFLDTEISGNSITLTAKDVVQVTQTELLIVANDSAGGESLEAYPITIYPLTHSSLGQTLSGRKLGNGIHLVILGDGYQEYEMLSLQDHAFDLVGLMRSDPAIESHFGAWNIHLVSTPSLDSGIDDSIGIDSRSTVFDSGYNCRGIERLICANQTRMFEIALAEYPYLDQIVMLVNDRRYGGSGGSVAIASAFTPEIALHELGHSFANLADEYTEGQVKGTVSYSEGQFANVSSFTDPDSVPWAHWIEDKSDYPTQPGDEGIGIFQGAYYDESNLYRPVSASRMRFNARNFGSVNGEQWAISVYGGTNPIDYISPLQTSLILSAGAEQRFYVEPVFGVEVQLVEWYLNDEPLDEYLGMADITLALETGEHKVELQISDISGRIKDPFAVAGEFRWVWDVTIQ